MCPDVRCPAVSADCQTIEYIVFQYDYQVRGRVINVRCESCEYCLDAPSNVTATSRRRRFASRSTDSSSSRTAAVSLSKRSCLVVSKTAQQLLGWPTVAQ